MQNYELINSLLKRKTLTTNSASSSTEFSDLEIASLFLDAVPRAMKEVRVELRKSRSIDLTVPQFRVLANLWSEPANNRMLAETLGLSVAATSRMIDWLIKHGLVEKAQHKTDRRQVVVQLSPLGKRSFEINQKRTRMRFKKRIQNLPESTKQDLALGLIALQNAIKAMSTP